MPILPDSSQWQDEADRIAASEAITATSQNDASFALSADVPRDERVCSQPQHLYRLPEFVRITATPKAIADGNELLRELWQINEEYVGEFAKEAEAYVCLSDNCRHLTDLFMEWCQAYFAKRMQQANPKDKSDFGKFVRLRAEYDRILGRLESLPNNVNYVFLSGCVRYVEWILWRWSGTNEFVPPDIRQLPIAWPAPPGQLIDPLERAIDEVGLRTDFLAVFLLFLNEAADNERVSRIAQMSADDMVAQLSDLMNDIQEMRPFLIRSFDPVKTAITLTRKKTVVLGWDWSIADSSAANLQLELNYERFVESYRVRGTNWPVRVRQDGLLIDGRKPWVTAAIENRLEDVNSLALNVYVVEMFHEQLNSFYEQIDRVRVRNEAKEQLAQNDSLELDDAAFAAINQDIASKHDEEASFAASRVQSKSLSIPQLRMQRLIAILRKLGCKVEGGKGSHVKIWRDGSRIFTLPRHKRNDYVSSLMIKSLLKRVGISDGKWFGAQE